MRGIWSDIKLAFRSMRKSLLLSAAAILSLALGVSANSVVFSVLSALVLHPLPFPEPDRLVIAWQNRLESPEDIDDVAPANYVDWSAQNRSFQHTAAFTPATFNLSEEGSPEEVAGMQVTPGFIDTLQTPLLRGRVFTDEEAVSEHSDVVIISSGLWQKRFGSDPNAVGRKIRLNGISHEIVGIMRPGWFLVPYAEVWVPLGWSQSELKRDDHRLTVIGRLRAGVSLEQARTDMSSIARQLAALYPTENSGYGVLLKPVGDVLPAERDRRILIILMGAVGIVLLIACANVANLQMARANARAKEVAIRSALGASRWLLVRQHLVGSLVLALAGGVLGLAFSWAGIKTLAASVSLRGYWNEITLDATVMTFTLAVSVLSGIAFGILPALHGASSGGLRLKQDSRTATRSGSFRRFGRTLVALEVMLAVALLAIGADMIRAFLELRHESPGFDTKNLITMRVSLPPVKYGSNQFSKTQRVTLTFDQIAEKLKSLPGVTDVAYTTILPRSESDPKARFVLSEEREKLGGDAPIASWRAVNAGYFQAMRIPILEGREFTSDDKFGNDPVIVISASMAKRFFHGRTPLGEQVYFFDGLRRIVGIAADTLLNRTAEPRPCIYMPHAQSPRLSMSLLVRVAGDPSKLMRHVAGKVWEVDRDQPVSNVMTYESHADLQFAGPRLITDLLLTFCLIALVMAATGLYGLISYLVAQRTKEIGIRMALGASRATIFGDVMKEVFAVTGAGVLAAIFLLAASWRVLADFWGGAVKAQWETPLAITGLVLTVAAIATLAPATRATSIAPSVALRED
jgi:putative ABC transport system permease protein